MGYCRSPFVIGRIHYLDRRSNARERSIEAENEGIIVYIKSAVIRENSAFVRDFDRQNAAFPHEPTTNQWFSESEFEAYRLLGIESARKMLDAMTSGPPPWWRGEVEEWEQLTQQARRLMPLSAAAAAGGAK
jgi:hypothetical protein